MKKLWATTLAGFICTIFAGGIEVALGPEISGLGPIGLLAFAAGIGTIVLAIGTANGLASLAGRLRSILAPIVIAVLWMPAFYLVGDSMTEGGWIAQQSWVGMIPWAAGLMGGIGIFVCTLILRRWPDSAPLTVGLVIAAVILWGVDARILPGLYPLPHLLLTGLAIQSILAAAWRLADRLPDLKFDRALTAIAVTLLLVAPLAWFNLGAGLRAELVLRGGIATNLAQHLGRPINATFLTQMLNEVGPGAPVDPKKEARKPIVDNVLFVFVDTLRFDALPPSRPDKGVTIRPADSPFLNGFLKGCHTFERAYAQASATHQSIPPTFRSIEAWESAKEHGTALGLEYQDAGISTFAVVNNYFFEPRFDVTQRLLDGFESINVYTVFEQNDVVPLSRTMLERHRSKRFFGWVHIMAMHDAGYDDKYLDSKIPRKKRYQMSMRWTDRTFGKFVSGLLEQGLLENTAIVIASDHGEGLGDNNIWNHGPTVYEEEIRVPLAICLPPSHGEGQVHSSPVGNIDIVPTVHELLGLPANTQHRGHSLVPVLSGEERSNPYYLSSYNSKMVGLYKDGQKLTYQPKQGIFMRFDLLKDPKENRNLYGQDPKVDDAFRHELFLKNPSLLKDEVPLNEALISEKIRQMDPDTPTDSLLFLLKLAATAPSSATDTAAATLLEKSSSELVRNWVMVHLSRQEAIADVVRRRLEDVAGKEEEIAWIQEVGRSGVEPEDHAWVRGRLKDLNDPALLEEWLSWTQKWKKDKAWFQTWETLVPKATNHTTQELLLRNIGKSDSRVLEDFVLKSLSSDDGEVRTAALRQVANYKELSALAAIEASLRDQSRNLRERQAAVPAFNEIRGANGLDELLKVAENDEILSLDIMKIFIKHEDVPRLKALLALYPRLKRDIDWEIKRIQKKQKK